MSILIKGMKMPKNCAECEISQAYDIRSTWCPLTFTTQAELKRQDNCPLIELPPHGRLIDADALHIDLMDRGIEDIQTSDWYEIRQAVDDAPTIIEAETCNNSDNTCNKAEDDAINANIESEGEDG